MLSFIRGFIALFVLMTILIYLVPGETFQKYIRFFSEIILAIGFLYPVLSFVCDSEAFLDTIRYEEFTENLSEVSRDSERIAFLQNDYYIEEYENAIGEDVKRIAEQYGFSVTEVAVHMTEQYTVDSIWLSITDEKEGNDTVIKKIEVIPENSLGGKALEEAGTDNAEARKYAPLKEELMMYYQLEEDLIEIAYRDNG